MKILVCGGRGYDKRRFLYNCLEVYLSDGKPLEIAHGGANGADALAGAWAALRKVPCTVFPADWNKHGKAAGPIRNEQMLSIFKPDLVLAFPGGKGTAHMVKIARAAGVTTISNLTSGDDSEIAI